MAASPPPALMDDVIIDILLRLTPDDTACLTRASLVCKAWHRLLSDGSFLRRYREIHGALPVLGFLYNNYSSSASFSPLFIATKPSSPLPASAVSPTHCRTVDSRHGRVLLFHPACPSSFIVWDPITGMQRCFSAPVHPDQKFMAAVLCTCSGCDHIGRSSSGPFVVVLVAEICGHGCWPGHEPVAKAQASLYSSDTGKWSVFASIDFHYSITGTAPSLLAGDTLFFIVRPGRILKYDLTRGLLSAVMPWVPIHYMQNMILCTAEDGGLGVAAMEDSSCLRLVSGRTNVDGVTEWVQARVIELDLMVSSGVGDHFTNFHVVGFVQGTDYIFIRANDNIFSVELKSGRISKIGSGLFGPILPFTRFYIPDLPSTRLQVAVRTE